MDLIVWCMNQTLVVLLACLAMFTICKKRTVVSRKSLEMTFTCFAINALLGWVFTEGLSKDEERNTTLAFLNDSKTYPHQYLLMQIMVDIESGWKGDGCRYAVTHSYFPFWFLSSPNDAESYA